MFNLVFLFMILEKLLIYYDILDYLWKLCLCWFCEGQEIK